MAGFAAAHGSALLTITQRTIHASRAGRPVRELHYTHHPEVPQSLGNHLAAARKAAGLKAKELAVKSGISRKWLGRWERGRCLPSQTEWDTLCLVLVLPPLQQFSKVHSGLAA
jgi:DNA-binding transcriptional regulator YiaG